MAAIKGKNTKPELFLRKLLFFWGYRYRLYSDKIPGHPDIWMRKYNTAVFVNGCFWHRHAGCKYAYTPKSRLEFWNKKFNENINRDSALYNQLREKNIRCLVVWECTIRAAQKKTGDPDRLASDITEFLYSDKMYGEL